MSSRGREGAETMRCIACGIEIFGKDRKYCSRACANKHRRVMELEQHEEKLVFSCGGGVDSTAIAALICEGKIEKPDIGVMVDTGYEKTDTMRHVRDVIVPNLERAGMRFEIIRTKDWYPEQKIISDTGFCVCPLFRKGDERNKRMQTCCNEQWKVIVIRKWLASIGVHRVKQIIGIAADEAHRMRESRRTKEKHWYPLVELGMTREDCIAEIEKMGWNVPPHSSCIICGQQTDGEFWRMKFAEPKDFERACEIEREIQKIAPDIYIHRSCRPLDKVFSM